VALSDRRDLTENLPLRIEPIIERRATPIPSLTIELIGSRRDQDMQVLAGQYRPCLPCLRRQPVGLLLGSLCVPGRCCRRMLIDVIAVSFLGLPTQGQRPSVMVTVTNQSPSPACSRSARTHADRGPFPRLARMS